LPDSITTRLTVDLSVIAGSSRTGWNLVPGSRSFIVEEAAWKHVRASHRGSQTTYRESKQALGPRNDERLAIVADQLPSKEMEVLSRRCRVHYVHVNVGGVFANGIAVVRQLEHPLNPRGRVFGASTVESVWKHKNNTALPHPLGYRVISTLRKT
jgi:hypothetical protein